MKRLEEICIFIRNGLNIKNDKSKKGIPITRIETISNGIIDINKTGYANIFNDKYIDYYLRQDDILMSHINSLKHLGKVGYCYYDMKIIHGMNLLNIRVNPNNVYPKYLYYYFKSNNFKIKLNKISKQSVNQSSFSISDLKKIRIDIIDLKKQKLIVSKLDKVVEVISIRKKQIEELNNLIKSQFVEMFGTIKENKKDYPIKTLIEVFELIKDGTHSTPVYTTDKENGVKFLSAKDVSKGRIDWENTKYIPIELHEKLVKRIKPQINDILLAKNGTTGICAKVNNEEIFDIYVSLALLRPNLENSSDYLVHAINNEETKEQFEKSLKGVGVPNLHLGEIKKVKIIVPPLKIQNEFSEIVKQIDKQKFESMIQLKIMEKIYNMINDRRRYV